MGRINIETLLENVQKYLERNLLPPDDYLYMRDVERWRKLEFVTFRWRNPLDNHYRKATHRVRQESVSDETNDALTLMRRRKPAEAPRLDLRQMELERHVEYLKEILLIGGDDLGDAITYIKQRMFLH